MSYYRYGFNGKEKDTDGEWGENTTNYDFGARIYNPAIGRWLSKDPLSKEFVSCSPYNFAINNPVRVIDPDGRTIIIGVEGVSNANVDAFIEVINENLGGQFYAVMEQIHDKEGKVIEGKERLRILDRNGGGDVSKLSSGQKAFYSGLMFVAEKRKEEATIQIVSEETSVATGKYLTGEIDIADIKQFPHLGPTIENQEGPTQAGKILHELTEQFFKQGLDGIKLGSDKNREINHIQAIGFEDGVNGNVRNDINDSYTKPDGTVTQFEVGGVNTKPVISITKRRLK